MCSGQDLNLHALASQASEACVYTVPPPEQREEEENNFLSAVKVPPTYVGEFFRIGLFGVSKSNFNGLALSFQESPNST